MDIDQTPYREWAGASSCYLKTEYADDSVLDTVVVGFCNPLIAFIRKPEQISLHNCAATVRPILDLLIVGWLQASVTPLCCIGCYLDARSSLRIWPEVALPESILGYFNTSSLSVESETHPPARTQTLARRHREQKLPSLSSASSCRRARENLVCNGRREIRRASLHPERLLATTATCYKAGARRRSWYWPSSSGRSD